MTDLTLDNERMNSSSSSTSASYHDGRRLHQCLADILTDMSSAQSMLPYFIQYMDASGAVRLVEFWLAVESFRSGRDRSVTTLPSTRRHRHCHSPHSLSPTLNRSLSTEKGSTSSPLRDGYYATQQSSSLTREVIADGGVSTGSNVTERAVFMNDSSKDVVSKEVAEGSSSDEGKAVLLKRPTHTEAEYEEDVDGMFPHHDANLFQSNVCMLVLLCASVQV